MMQFITDYVFLPYLVIAGLITFVLYGADKSKAKAHKWRIPEKVLLGASLLGGFPGGWLGMYVFHHKTKRWYFYAVNFAAALLWTVGFGLCKGLT